MSHAKPPALGDRVLFRLVHEARHVSSLRFVGGSQPAVGPAFLG